MKWKWKSSSTEVKNLYVQDPDSGLENDNVVQIEDISVQIARLSQIMMMLIRPN